MKWSYQAATRRVHLEIKQTQKLDAQTGLFSFPLEVALIGEKDAAVRRVPVAARALRASTSRATQRPLTVVLDPRGF